MYVIIFVLTLDEIEAVTVIMPHVRKEWADKIIFVDGDERKMRPLTIGAQLSYQIIKEFIKWKW